MIGYLTRRVLQAAFVVVAVSMIIFGLLWLLPGGPGLLLLGSKPGSALAVRYLRWLVQVAHGNLGYSTVQSTSVGSVLAASLPRTLLIVGLATLLAAAVAVPAGLIQAANRDRAADRALRGVSYIGYGMPPFLLGSVLILFFAVQHHIFGAEGPQADGIASVATDWRDLTLPVITLAVPTIAMFSRYVRAAALDVLGQDYVRTARASGANGARVLTRHVLRNSMGPVITLAGLSLPRIFAGALVVESLFNIRGMGWQLWQAAGRHDYAVLLGFTLVLAVGTVSGSLLADIGYAIADPRVRYGRT